MERRQEIVLDSSVVVKWFQKNRLYNRRSETQYKKLLPNGYPIELL
jgi:hypothetical protein